MSNKISGKVLAVQLSREESRLVLLGGAGEVLHAVTLLTPPGAVDDGVIRNPEAIRAMLKEALRQPAFEKVRKVVFTLCTSQVIAETVRTPDLPEAKLSKLLRANADMYFPVDIKDHQLVWQIIDSTQNQDGMKELTVQLWAVPADMLKPYYNVANSCGLSVTAIDYCGHSMASVAGASFAKAQKTVKEPKKLDLNKEITFGSKKKAEHVVEAPSMEPQGPVETQLFLSLDQDLLGMTFVQKNQVVMQRIIRCGSQLFYQFGELAMMLEYFQSMDVGRGSTIRGFVTGSYANDPLTVAELADMLGISLVALALPYDLGYCLCVGAAQTQLDFGNPALNVVDKARREVQSQLWQYGLLLAGGLALLGVVIFTLTARLSWNSDLRKLKSQQQTLTIQASKVGDYADKYNEYVNKYNAYSEDWDDIFINLQTSNDNLVLVMEELENMLPENSSVVGMQIGESGLSVTFACEDKEEAAYLIMSLDEMKYATLMRPVSDLVGGGSGPATTYGSGKETAPKEGSANTTQVQWEMLKASISADMDPYVVGYNLGLGLKKEMLLDKLEESYGLVVNNVHANMADLILDKGEELTYQKRADAFWAMCTSNPFVMNAAEDLLMQDYANGGDLWMYVMNALEEEGYGAVEVTRHRSPEELQEHIEVLAGIIVTYNGEYDALSRTEELICSDPKMEAWYIYYLEAELEKFDETLFFGEFAAFANSGAFEDDEPLPYLDLDKVTEDLLSDRDFDSASEALNSAMLALMSSETMALVDAINPPVPEIPDEPTFPSEPEEPSIPVEPEDPSIPVEPEEPSIPVEPEDPSIPVEPEDPSIPVEPEDPSIPVEPEDPSIPVEPDEPSTPSEPEELYPMYAQILQTYLPGYLTKDELPAYGNVTDTVRAALDNYFETGKSGQDMKYDSFLNDHIASEAVDGELTDLIATYKQNPDALMNQSVRKMLDNYYNKTTTGNLVLDAWVARCAANVEVETESIQIQIMRTYLPDYLREGSLPAYGNTTAEVEKMLNRYFENGKVGGKDSKYDEFLDEHIASGALDADLMDLIVIYKQNPKELENQSIRKMLDKYFGFRKTTGNKVQDEWIKRCNLEVAPPESEPGEELDPTYANLLKTYLPDYLLKDELPAYGDVTNTVRAALDSYFETGKSGQDTKYDNFLDEYIASKAVDAEMTTLIADYKKDPSSLKNPSIRKMLENYYNKGNTGNTVLNDWVKRCQTSTTPPVEEPEEELDPTYAQILKTYLLEGTLPSYGDVTSKVKVALDNFFATGKSGEDTKYDNFLNDYIASKAVDEELVSLIYAFNQDPTALKNQSIRKMLDNYFVKGTTGSAILDAWIVRCMANQGEYVESIADKLTDWLSKYLTSGSTGDANGNVIIELYLSTGKVGSYGEYTMILDDYVKDGKVDAALKNLLKICLYNKNTLSKYPAILALFENYYKGTTGSAAMDAQIKKIAKELANSANKGGGNKTPEEQGPTDTRVFFAAFLEYNEELKHAELIRKGLDRTKKIAMLEVGN